MIWSSDDLHLSINPRRHGSFRNDFAATTIDAQTRRCGARELFALDQVADESG
jgi:hypothetical protein